MSLEKLALVTAILGTLFLIFISENLEAKERGIGDITSKDVDNYVKVSGNITAIKQYSTSTLIKIEDNTGTIYAISYGRINLTKGPIVLTGKVTEYKGTLEIEIERIIS